MRRIKTYSVILLMVMALNINKRQLPYLEYYLFRNYIAENLCVDRNKTHNCCQGQCHLNKQIELADKTDNESATDPASKIQVNLGTDDYVSENLFLQTENPVIKKQTESLIEWTHIIKMILDVPEPPPKQAA